MPLAAYRKKRSFAKTPEPRGSVSKRAKTRRPLVFVVQKHAAAHLHYDLRLELGGALKSWAVPKGPSMNPAHKRLAVAVEDHPLAYARFAGRIPKGQYGAGIVAIWDRGGCRAPGARSRAESERMIRRGLRAGTCSFILSGKKLKGGFALVRLPSRSERAWLLIKERDGYAKKTKRV